MMSNNSCHDIAKMSFSSEAELSDQELHDMDTSIVNAPAYFDTSKLSSIMVDPSKT